MRLLVCMFWVISVVETKDGTVSVASAFAGYQEGNTNNLLLLGLFIAALFQLYICFGSQVFWVLFNHSNSLLYAVESESNYVGGTVEIVFD